MFFYLTDLCLIRISINLIRKTKHHLKMKLEIRVYFNVDSSDTCCQRLLCQKYARNVLIRIYTYKTYKHLLLLHRYRSINELQWDIKRKIFAGLLFRWNFRNFKQYYSSVYWWKNSKKKMTTRYLTVNISQICVW